MKKTKKQIQQEQEEFRAKLEKESFERSRKMIRKYVVIGFAFAILIATILFLSSLSQVPEETVNPSIGVISTVQVPVNGSEDTAVGITPSFFISNWWMIVAVFIIFWFNKKRYSWT